MNKKIILIVIFSSLTFFPLSMIYRAIHFIDFIQTKVLIEYNSFSASFGNILMFLLEFILVWAIFSPYQKYLTSLKSYKKDTETEKEEATVEALNFCSTAMSYHNKYLTVHIKNVGLITELILNELKKNEYYQNKLTDDFCNDLVFSVQFHDIGKIYIDSSLLDKPGKLSDDEFTQIKNHTIKGLELFNLLPKNVLSKNARELCRDVIVEHHERLDGSGYPMGKKGDSISLGAQIVAVADVADALLSWRPYKQPMSWEKAFGILQDESGKKLNKDCCDVLLNVKNKLLEISDKGNQELKEIFKLSDTEIIR